MTSVRSLWLRDLLGIVLLAAAATLPFLFWPIDIAAARIFFRPHGACPWADESWLPWKVLYRFGPWLALAVGSGALIALALAPFKTRLAPWRPHLLYLVLTLILGPGLVVNVLFKDHWGRPRPRQVQELGGQWQHQQVFEKGVGGRGKSFPCGHSSMGYYFVAFYFLARRRHRAIAFASLAFAAFYGTVIGLGRMAAGAHFLSDVLWSAVFTAVTAFVLYYFVIRIPDREDSAASRSAPASHPYLTATLAMGVVVLAIGAGLLATPVYRELADVVPLPRGRPVALTMDTTGCDVILAPAASADAPLTVTGEIQGFGWPWSKIRKDLSLLDDPGGSRLDFSIRKAGYFSEFAGQIRIVVPVACVTGIVATVRKGDIIIRPGPAASWPVCRFTVQEGTVEAPAAWQTPARSSADGAQEYLIRPPVPSPAP